MKNESTHFIFHFPRFNLLLALFWLAFSSTHAIAEQPSLKFKRLSLEDGLSQSSVLSILQDRKGFLWFGTQDGLNRYDGYNFLVYRNDSQNPYSLSGNRVFALFEDHSDTLWVGTNTGLNRFDQTTGKFIRYQNNPQNPKSLSSNRVTSLCENSTGNLWIGTADGGLNLLNPETGVFTRYVSDANNPHSLSSNRILSLCLDRAGVLWVGTADSGLNRLDQTTGNFVRLLNDAGNSASLSSNSLRVIHQDQTGVLWVGTAEDGLNRLDPAKGTFTHFVNQPAESRSLSNNSIRAIYSDHNGTLWIGTDRGVNRLDTSTGTFTRYFNDPQNPLSLSHNDIRALYEDRAGSLWVGTLGGGVNRLEQTTRPFRHLVHDPRNPKGLSHNGVRAVFEDHSGKVWIGTNGGGLNRFDRETGDFIAYLNIPGNSKSLSSNRVWSVYEDRTGTLWVGTLGGGLNRMDEATGTCTHYLHDPNDPTSLTGNDVVVVCQDRSGGLWVGTSGSGLNRMDPTTGRFTHYLNNPQDSRSLSSNEVSAITQDHTGALWVGTSDGGLNRMDHDTQTFTHYQHDPNNLKSLTSNGIRSLYEDKAGVLWIGTEGGLNRLDATVGEFTAFSTKDGLPNDVIYGILEDWAGNLWLSTNAGLCKFNPKTKTCHTYDIRDGLQSNEFNAGACFQSSQGEMFFGGINGFNSFHPEEILDNPYIPPVVITGFQKFDRKVDALNNQDQVVLRFDENFLAFEFAALNYTLPEKNQYAYQLEGFDKKWIHSGTRRYASYTNLNPGEYVFHVKGSNNDGVWNEDGIRIGIKVLPPLWKTWWAYGLYLGFLGGGLVGAFRFQNNRVQARARLQEAQFRAETAEVQAQAAQAKAEISEVKAQAADQLTKQNAELDQKNRELAKKNEELIASQQQADRIFSALAEALSGTVLDGKYRLEEKIGAGGFGAVFRAVHLGLNRPIAVKVFKPKSGNDSADAVERFKREGISAARLNHPNAIQVLDSGISTEGIAYLVMELLQGHNLADELKRHGHLSLRRCTQIIRPICEALAEAHRMGIIHRDIKPENIFLNQTATGEVVKVLDFGVAKMMSEDTGEELARLTMTGGIVGTPVYMSPERLEGKPFDGRSDVYSVGVMLYEMLSGQVPFKADSSGFIGIVMAHLRDAPPPLSSVLHHIPPEVESVVMQALEKNPNHRPTALELAEMFTSNVSQLPAPAVDEIVERTTIQTSENDNLPTISMHFTTFSNLQTLDTTSGSPEQPCSPSKEH